MLLVSGESSLGMISRNDNWKFTYSDEISHKKNMTITTLTWINDSVLATGSLDKTIVFWNFNQNKVLNRSTSTNEII